MNSEYKQDYVVVEHKCKEDNFNQWPLFKK